MFWEMRLHCEVFRSCIDIATEKSPVALVWPNRLLAFRFQMRIKLAIERFLDKFLQKVCQYTISADY